MGLSSVLLLSGGLDSATALYELVSEGSLVFPLTVRYGQKHSRELDAAARLCDRLCLPLEIADLSSIQPLISSSALTNPEIAVPEGHYEAESMKSTVVPNRNMMMLSVAMAWGISIGVDRVVYAAHAGDHAIYPDCRPEFVQSMQQVAALCDWTPLKLSAPFLNARKEEIVARGNALRVPFEETWSCYNGGEVHCGRCGTCVERKEAFVKAGLPDPTLYESKYVAA